MASSMMSKEPTNFAETCCICRIAKVPSDRWACPACLDRLHLHAEWTTWPHWVQRGRQTMFALGFQREMERLERVAAQEEADCAAEDDDWDDDYAVTCDVCGTTFMCKYDYNTLDYLGGRLPEAEPCPKCGCLVDIPREWAEQLAEEGDLEGSPWAFYQWEGGVD